MSTEKQRRPAQMDVRVIKASAPVEKSLVPEQIDRTDWDNSGDWITQPTNMRGYRVMLEQSTILPQCAKAYRNNIPGYGIGVRYKDDAEETPELEQEYDHMVEVIDLLNLDMDTKEVFEDLIEARETYGIAYLEVIRNLAGEVAQIEFIKDTPSITKTKPLEPYQTVEYTYKGRKGTRQKKFMKYRQELAGKTVYFKEFGDKRIMDKRTGAYVDTLDIEYQANEIMEFAIGTEPYGTVRWVGQILSVDGARKAEFLNNNYFVNGRHTPLMIMIKGGTLSEESFEKLQHYMNDIKGVEGQHAFIVLETEAADNTTDFETTTTPDIEVKDLASILQTDELFQDYLDNGRRKVQSAFLLPDLYVGYTTDFNRATAQTAMEVTEKQVFQPERKSLEWAINNRLLAEYGFEHVEAYFLEPDISNPDDLVKILTICNTAGGLTPNKAKQIALEAIGEVSEDYEGDWGNIPLAYSKGSQNASEGLTSLFEMSAGLNKAIQKAAGNHDDEIVAVMKEVRNLLRKGFTNPENGMIIKDGWDESDHPRDEAGKFAGGSSTSEAAAHEELNKRIADGTVSTKLDTKKQNKHIEGTAEYEKAKKNGSNPSRLTIDESDRQKLIDKYTKEGEAHKRADGSIRVSFKHSETIGVSSNISGSKETSTSFGEIHYSKTGAHIVPVSRKGQNVMKKADLWEDWEDWVDNPNSEINRMMVKTALNELRVRVVGVDDTTYEGYAHSYVKGDDEEDGIPTFCIMTDDKGGWCLGENEIKSIEEL